MTLRLATETDIPDVVRMCRLFHSQETTLSETPFEDDKVEAVVRSLISDPYKGIAILICKPDPVGVILGTVTELIFNFQVVAAELAWWIDPEHRRSRDAFKLIDAFEYWAKNIAKADLIQLSSTHTNQTASIEKYYSRKGYRLSENSYIKEL